MDPSDRSRLVGTINSVPDGRSSKGQHLDCEGETTQGSLDAPHRDEDGFDIHRYDDAKGQTPYSAGDGPTNGPDDEMLEYEGEDDGDIDNEAEEGNEDEDEDEDDTQEGKKEEEKEGGGEEDEDDEDDIEEENEEEEEAEHEEIEEDEDQRDVFKPRENLLTLPRELRDEVRCLISFHLSCLAWLALICFEWLDTQNPCKGRLHVRLSIPCDLPQQTLQQKVGNRLFKCAPTIRKGL